MARTTISIPDQLKRRMDEYADGNVNWSAVAARAFESKLTELVSAKGAKSMQAVVARLKATRNSSDSTKSKGREIGRNWAMNSATFDHLNSLDGWRKSLGTVPAREGLIQEDYGSALEAVFAIIEPEETDEGASERFWTEVLGYTPPHDNIELALAFVGGALEVWYQVKDEFVEDEILDRD